VAAAGEEGAEVAAAGWAGEEADLCRKAEDRKDIGDEGAAAAAAAGAVAATGAAAAAGAAAGEDTARPLVSTAAGDAVIGDA
jgi:hypothetical protein